MPSHSHLAKIHILLKERKLTAQKEDLVHSFTGGRSTSARDLTHQEASQMIAYLSNDQDAPVRLQIEKQRGDAMKAKVISMAHQLGWKLPTGKINMDAVNKWCREYGRFKKELDDHTYKELAALVTQFEFGPYAHGIRKYK